MIVDENAFGKNNGAFFLNFSRSSRVLAAPIWALTVDRAVVRSSGPRTAHPRSIDRATPRFMLGMFPSTCGLYINMCAFCCFD